MRTIANYALIGVLLAACSSSASPSPTTEDAGPLPTADAAVEMDATTAADATPPQSDAGTDATTAQPPYRGSANGFSLTVVDQTAHREGPRLLTGPLDPQKPWQSVLQIYLRDVAGTCTDYGANVRRKNSKEVEVKLTLTGATEADATLKAGTYSFSAFNEADVSRVVLRSRDATCTIAQPANVSVENATKRELVIESLTANHIKGHFSIENGSEVLSAGRFDTDFCAQEEPSGTSMCQ